VSDPYQSLTCPWNGPLSNLRGGAYDEKRLRASIPVFQESSAIPIECYNTDTTRHHIPISQLSFQFGRSKLYQYWEEQFTLAESTQVKWNDQIREQFLADFQNNPRTKSGTRTYFDHSIPNPPNNITRMYYDNESSVLGGAPDTDDLGTRVAMENQLISGAPILDNQFPQNMGFPFSVPNYDNSAQQGFPDTASPDYRGRQDPVWRIFPALPIFGIETFYLWPSTFWFNPLVKDTDFGRATRVQVPVSRNTVSYFHNFVQYPAMSITVEPTITSQIPGCDRFGCSFFTSATTCSQQTVNLFTGYNNDFYNPFDPQARTNTSTGCGIVTTHLYKAQYDPGYRALCCRRLLGNHLELSNTDSLTIRSDFIYGSSPFTSPITPKLFSPETVYCDPSWQPGSAACDAELESFCGMLSLSRGDGTWINACLSQTHPCSDWYNWIMYSYTTNGFTKRNINIVTDFITRYCGNNPQDTVSCACVQSFVKQQGYYTVDGMNSYSLVVAKRDNTGLFFTDPLCSSLLCNTDPSNFDLAAPGATGASTLVSPSIVQAKRQCPNNACFLINDSTDLTAINISAGTEISLANTSLFCQLGGQPDRVQVNYDVLVQGYDVQPGIIGRAFYDPVTGLLTGDSFPRVKLTFQLLTTVPGITLFNCQYTITTDPVTPTFFNFSTNSGAFNFTQQSPEQDLFVVQTPSQGPVNSRLPCFGEYMSFFQATLTTSVNSVQCIKQFPVRVLMVPLYLKPLKPETSLPLPSIPKPLLGDAQLSRVTVAVLFLCGILLFYALGFLVEIALIRNFQQSLRNTFP